MKPKVEEIKVNLDELNPILRLRSAKQKYQVMRKYGTGPCIRCDALATHKLIYDIGDGALIELYCKNCLKDSERVSEGRNKKFISKLAIGS